MRKIKVSRINNFKHTNKFNPARIANLLLLQSGFNEEKIAHINYKHGKLKILLNKQSKQFYEH